MLPLDTQILLRKLIDWEAGEKSSLDKRVQTKSSEVAIALKAHLKKATQAGDLKTANLIQAKIDELQAVAVKSSPKKASQKAVLTNEQILQLVTNSTWEIYGSDTHIIEYHFTSPGKGKRVGDSGSEYSLIWKIEDGAVMFMDYVSKKWITVTISSNGKEMTPEFPTGAKLRYRKK